MVLTLRAGDARNATPPHASNPYTNHNTGASPATSIRDLPDDIRFDVESIDPESGCWLWAGPVNDEGYGRADRVINGRREYLAHRWAYKLLVGSIDAETLDHTCHNPKVCPPGIKCPHRRCINPAHLEPKSVWGNTRLGGAPSALNAAKSHCDYGHEFNEENTWVDARGWRVCRTCRRLRNATPEAHAKRYERYLKRARRRSEARSANPPAAKSHCRRGHEYTPENTYVRPEGQRMCRTCMRRRKAEVLERKRGGSS